MLRRGVSYDQAENRPTFAVSVIYFQIKCSTTGLQMLASQGLMPIDASYEEASPFLKWAGGKSQLLDQLRRYFPSRFKRYFEPFLGGGAVFFSLRPEESILSDANFELINTYKVIAKNVDELILHLTNLQKKTLTQELYYDIRESQDPQKLTAVERAARFIFLNKTCYNGLYRVNSRGKFNVPFGKYDKMPKLFESSNLRSVSACLKSATLEPGYYNIVLNEFDADQGDFVYLDPPYADENGTGFTSYTKDLFNWSEQEKLAKEFKRLAKKGCQVMLSNSATPKIKKLYSGVAKTIVPVKADRMINCNGKDRTGFTELIIMSYVPKRHSLKSWIRE